MAKSKTIYVKGAEVILINKGGENYVSLTDIARFKNAIEPKDVVKNWMRSRSTIEFLGFWEKFTTLIFEFKRLKEDETVSENNNFRKYFNSLNAFSKSDISPISDFHFLYAL
jgi:hypothetical protein